MVKSDFGYNSKVEGEVIVTRADAVVNWVRSHSVWPMPMGLACCAIELMASGGSRLHAIRFGILPQVAPVLISQALYYFESNTRSATIIGIVGAGGIGLQLSEQIRTLEWQTVCFIIIMILVTVSLIDLISTRLRNAIAGPSASRG